MEQYINHFQNPWFLLALPLVLLWLVLHVRADRRRPTVTFSGLDVAKDLPVSMRQRVNTVLPYLRALVLMLGIVALARPQFGTLERSVSSLGLDIAMVIDVSGSMQAQDYQPNRMEAAKTAAAEFVSNRETDRLMVVIFGENAAMLVPPTLDTRTVKTFIETINFQMIRHNATAIGDGLGLALRRLKDSPAESQVIVLLTDGDNNAGVLDPLQAAEIAKTMEIPIYVIGVGNNPMRQIRGFGMMAPPGGVGFDESIMESIAEATGGQYFRAGDEAGLRNIYREVDKLVKSEIETSESYDYNERFMLFWFPALALLGLEFFLRAFWLRRLP